MRDLGPLLALLALGGAALTLLGGFCIWWVDPARRIRRSLKKVLAAEPHALLAAAARGKGVGFDFETGMLAVAWDAGAWVLAYRIEELVGAELIVDDHVAARVHRGESRRPLERLAGAEERVRLRLVFDDLTYPDFELDLWLPDDEGRKRRLSAAEALQEANRWLARIDAIIRRPAPRRSAAAVAAPAALVPDDDGDIDDLLTLEAP